MFQIPARIERKQSPDETQVIISRPKQRKAVKSELGVTRESLSRFGKRHPKAAEILKEIPGCTNIAPSRSPRRVVNPNGKREMVCRDAPLGQEYVDPLPPAALSETRCNSLGFHESNRLKRRVDQDRRSGESRRSALPLHLFILFVGFDGGGRGSTAAAELVVVLSDPLSLFLSDTSQRTWLPWTESRGSEGGHWSRGYDESGVSRALASPNAVPVAEGLLLLSPSSPWTSPDSAECDKC
ncbi:hypothetical protein H6P81_014841 [Aristolochia fimbriata]|uniref:Uncharacterized protein n=1 Tax=Aristolochia fimbriata TaxID=158543 RepID=A0AAV7E6P7_ARIFI|nr:hypothetical protein H6P81_014841 [Aristolochia fimbriata]